MQQITCHSCKNLLDLEEKVGRQQTCPECNAYLRCCLNCRFYDASAYNECREPQADRIVDKEQGNFCDYFEPAAQVGQQDAAAQVGQQDAAAEEAKRALENLFKK